MCGASSMYRTDEIHIQKFWSENLKVRGHSEDLCVDGRIILKWILPL